MNTVRHKPIVFAVVSLLVISFVYSSISTSGVFALPPDPNWDPGGTCGAETTNPETGQHKQTCCWKETERGPYPKIGTREVTYCQTCTYASARDCGSKVAQGPPLGSDLPTAEIVPPIRTLPGDVGDLPTLEQVPGPGLNQGTEGEPTLPVICSEEAGLEKDPETGQCVPIEAPVTEEPEEPEEEPEEEQQQPEEEQQQPSAEEEGGNDNNDN